MEGCKCNDGSSFYVDGNMSISNCPDGCEKIYLSDDGSATGGNNLNGSNTKAGGVLHGFLEGIGLIGNGDDGPGDKSQNCQKLKDWTGLDLCKYFKWALIIIAIILLLKIALAIKKLF